MGYRLIRYTDHMKMPNEEQIMEAAKILSRLKPGFLPLPLFLEVTRLTVTPIVEVVPLRMAGDQVQVLLVRRGGNDPNWPGMLHTPGTVVRATDESYASAINRIFRDELASVEFCEPVYVQSVLHKTNRGMEDAKVYFVEVISEPREGVFYDVKALPANTVDSQIKFIMEAVKSFIGIKSPATKSQPL
jgi:hypothetical protein